MLDFQQKRKVRAVMYHKATLIVLFLVVLLALHSVWTVYKKKTLSEQMEAVALKQTAALRERNSELEANIARLQTPTGVEQEIRSKFTVAKNGENMVVLVDGETSTTSTDSKEPSFWQKLVGIFK